MDFRAIYTAVRTRMRAAVPAGWTFLEPNAPDQDVPAAKHIRLDWIPGPSSQITLGARDTRTFRHFGTAQLTLYVPIESGDDEIEDAIGSIVATFQSAADASITWRAPEFADLGRDERHYARAVSFPFWAEWVG